MKAKEKKETFTYSTIRSLRATAKKKAFKEGLTLSEVLHRFLVEYVKPNKK